MAKLSLESLELVDAIARRGSFAAAAEELGRVPSAVTYAARRLEEDLDVLLFDRAGYRARLTPAGEELLREGRHVLQRQIDPGGVSFWTDAALLAAAGIPTVVSGPIGAGAHAAEEWIDLHSAEQAATIYAQTALAYCQ